MPVVCFAIVIRFQEQHEEFRTFTYIVGCAGMAVFDTMRHIRPDVSTVCVGLAASMGAFLLASGHKVPPLLSLDKLESA